ncbi:hypothetical protein ACSI87_004059 [Salmonella enterica subsp. enterica serovar Brandenburg]|nr:hypothetical protein [Salmonella enterica subsp. enterica serovar Nima]EDS7029685.1 hypothetical protein [Salmonella enterica subsp. enterica]EIR7526226.1 hypothetical protein [Salmonella enterica subsp. enterica serovar Brandenburg]ECD6552512.1 hypothetical protein [Salmonella enterica subsp. enterica serovar Nima]EDW6033468.1 hypothetical protein [Salmonella enterica subsp. enterica]
MNLSVAGDRPDEAAPFQAFQQTTAMTWCGVGDGQKADCVIDDILKDDEPLHFLMRLTKIMLNEWK